MERTHTNGWVVGMGVLGAVGVLLGATLWWMLLTRPVMVAQALGAF